VRWSIVAAALLFVTLQTKAQHIARGKEDVECVPPEDRICRITYFDGWQLIERGHPIVVSRPGNITVPEGCPSETSQEATAMFVFTNPDNPDEGVGWINAHICSGERKAVVYLLDQTREYRSYEEWQQALPQR